MRIKFQVKLSEVCISYPGIAEQLGLVRNHDWTARLEKVSRFLNTLEAQGLAVLSFHEFEQTIRCAYKSPVWEILFRFTTACLVGMSRVSAFQE